MGRAGPHGSTQLGTHVIELMTTTVANTRFSGNVLSGWQ